MKMKIELTEEQTNTILIALIQKFDHDIECLTDNPESEYYIKEVVNTKKLKDYISRCSLLGGSEND